MMMSRRRTGVVGQIQWGDSPVFHTQMIPFTEIRPVLGIRPFVVDGASPPLGLEIKWKYPGLPYSNSTLTIRTDDVWRPNEQRTDTATPPPPLVDAMWHFRGLIILKQQETAKTCKLFIMHRGMDLILPCALCHPPGRQTDLDGSPWNKSANQKTLFDWLRRPENSQPPDIKHLYWHLVCIYEPFQAKTSTLIGRPSHEMYNGQTTMPRRLCWCFWLGGRVDDEKVSRLLICLVQFTLDSSSEWQSL